MKPRKMLMDVGGHANGCANSAANGDANGVADGKPLAKDKERDKEKDKDIDETESENNARDAAVSAIADATAADTVADAAGGKDALAESKKDFLEEKGCAAEVRIVGYLNVAALIGFCRQNAPNTSQMTAKSVLFQRNR